MREKHFLIIAASIGSGHIEAAEAVGDALKTKYPDAQIYSIQNSELGEEYNESSREVCAHYGIQLIELHDIDKQNGHPSIAGMQSICDQLLEAVK